MDPAGFRRGMSLLAVVFDGPGPHGAGPDERQVEERYAIYRLLLDDLDGEDFFGACAALANSSRFFPRPAELREATAGLARRRAGAARAEEYAERLALTEAREAAEGEVRRGVWDAQRRAFVPSGESAEAIYERWRQAALARLAAERAGEAPDDA